MEMEFPIEDFDVDGALCPQFGFNPAVYSCIFLDETHAYYIASNSSTRGNSYANVQGRELHLPYSNVKRERI
jgi:hypothetical protein